MAGAKQKLAEGGQANGFKLTPDQFRDAMTPATKMIILNSPGNPTGSVYSREELQALAEPYQPHRVLGHS